MKQNKLKIIQKALAEINVEISSNLDFLLELEDLDTEAIQTAYIKYLLGNNKLMYRQKVAAVVLNSKQQILLVQLIRYDEQSWNIPGGGVEKGESPKDAIVREISEELGTKKFKILKKAKAQHQYEWPINVVVRGFKEGMTHRGQIQIQFIIKFTGTDDDIKPPKNEIRKYKWVDIKKLDSIKLLHDQLENVKRILEEYENSHSKSKQ